MKRFTLEEFCRLSSWAQLWLSDLGHYEWGFNRDNLEPWNPAAVASHAESGQYAFDALLQRGPMLCAAVGQWHDRINAAKPNTDPVEQEVGFVSLASPQSVPIDRGVSAHGLAAEWLEKLGMAIVGRKPWNAAVAAAGPVAIPADYQAKLTKLVGKLYLHYEGVESLRLRMQDELSRVRGNESRSSARRPRSRRPGGKSAYRLTEKQLEAHRLYGETAGNMSEVAKRMGIARQVAKQHYDAAIKKLGRLAGAHAKPRTQAIPRDRRGQEMLPARDE